MTDYAPRGSQDQNSFFSTSPFGMSQYSNGNGMPYYYNSQIPYSTVNGSYSTYSNNYLPSQNGPPSPMYLSNPSNMAMQYQLLPPARPQMPQPRSLSYPYNAHSLPTQRSAQPRPRLGLPSDIHLNPMADIEDQTSYNADSMLSEAVDPPLEGYPDVKEFDELMQR